MRNFLFQRWLKTQRSGAFCQCSHVARMVREAKNDWYHQQPQLVEKGVTGGVSMHVVWQSCITFCKVELDCNLFNPSRSTELMDNCVVDLLRDVVSTFSLF